ncbi:aldo/keto reductase [Clostridium sp. 'deep sea']|uniref:aldo/keto reductase n=1 Tax=Clostridium sp. 'deep sea' TaxID=2779445 RepID=UPI0018965AC9|nr:aldo/keto reductase [Clostridium sp. 'deep sea']QOR34730.1 aldo/keto reductase [Clostridium sp. 'deep sea']
MHYRSFPCAPDKKISVLGFGCMRLPHLNNDSGQINDEEALKMVRYAIDNGVNYIDTAYPYHKGTSEKFVARALKNGYREKVYLATKHPVWLVEEYADFEKYLNEQLANLETDYIDFYMLHALSAERWQKIRDLGVIKFLEEARAKGKINHFGFSFHDELAVFKEIINSYPWDFAQIQLNFMDTEYQAGLEGLNYAADRGIGVIVMEPLRGGSLTRSVPNDIKDIWEKAETKRTPAEWCFKWVANHPSVVTILSGMSTIEQVEENVTKADDFLANSLTDFELELITQVRNIYIERTKVNCTACEYCLPCPAGVAIPKVFTLYNNANIYNDLEGASRSYKAFMIEKEIDASKCVECNKCLSACPQNIKIPTVLKEAHSYLTKAK